VNARRGPEAIGDARSRHWTVPRATKFHERGEIPRRFDFRFELQQYIHPADYYCPRCVIDVRPIVCKARIHLALVEVLPHKYDSSSCDRDVEAPTNGASTAVRKHRWRLSSLNWVGHNVRREQRSFLSRWLFSGSESYVWQRICIQL